MNLVPELDLDEYLTFLKQTPFRVGELDSLTGVFLWLTDISVLETSQPHLDSGTGNVPGRHQVRAHIATRSGATEGEYLLVFRRFVTLRTVPGSPDFGLGPIRV